MNDVRRLPWIATMRRLHRIHHRRDLMRRVDFDPTAPIVDVMLGTLAWVEHPPPNGTPERDVEDPA